MEVYWGHDSRVVLCNNFFHFPSLKYPQYAVATNIGLMANEHTRSRSIILRWYILLHDQTKSK